MKNQPYMYDTTKLHATIEAIFLHATQTRCSSDSCNTFLATILYVKKYSHVTL